MIYGALRVDNNKYYSDLYYKMVALFMGILLIINFELSNLETTECNYDVAMYLISDNLNPLPHNQLLV